MTGERWEIGRGLFYKKGGGGYRGSFSGGVCIGLLGDTTNLLNLASGREAKPSTISFKDSKRGIKKPFEGEGQQALKKKNFSRKGEMGIEKKKGYQKKRTWDPKTLPIRVSMGSGRIMMRTRFKKKGLPKEEKEEERKRWGEKNGQFQGVTD